LQKVIQRLIYLNVLRALCARSGAGIHRNFTGYGACATM
jgi:hypothetical protein